jgi:hypothetical protein
MKSDEPWKTIFNLKCLWLVLARFDYMGLWTEQKKVI